MALFSLALCFAALAMRGVAADGVTIANNVDTSFCLALPGSKPEMGINAIMRKCSDDDPSQVWTLDPTTGRISSSVDSDFCLTSRRQEGWYVVQMMVCGRGGDQKWQWITGGAISLPYSGNACLTADHKMADFNAVYLWTDTSGCGPSGSSETNWILKSRLPMKETDVVVTRKPINV
jgi:hypothetical protein